MSFNFNRVEIGGTLTRDPEISYTPKGTAVAAFSLAINRVWKDDQNTKHEECTFIDCEAWGKTAEILGEHTAKGHTIFIEGRLKVESWEDKETKKKRSKMKVVTEKMHFVSKPRGEGDSQPASKPPAKPQQQRPPTPHDPDLDVSDDDIPF
jgi:single-strand DNA-binding protein